MKKSSNAVLALALSLVAASSATAADKHYGNITEGHFEVSTSMSFNSVWQENRSQFTTFNLLNSSQYFVADRLGLGLLFDLQTSSASSSTSLLVGPVLSYFFWTSDRLAAFALQNAGVNIFSSGGSNVSTVSTTTQLGLDYFITPSVAVGPILQYFHQFGTSVFLRVNEFSVLGQFAIFL